MRKITNEYIKSRVAETHYSILPDGRTTVCSIVLVNGYTVTGSSSCLDRANFSVDLGRNYSFQKAFEKIFEVEAFLAMEDEYRKVKPVVAAPAAEAKPAAKWGYKADGTPKKAPGRPVGWKKKAKKAAPVVEQAPAQQ